MNGVLIIDKPAGLTSHDVVARARRILKERSIGHLGTLDPMATGVLPLVIGSYTRLAPFYTGAEKVYEGAIRFGFSTDTYDAEGQPTSPQQEVILRSEEVEALAGKFRGVIQQVPPPFSAKKIKGVPAYKLARKHKEVVLEPVQVEIKEFEILSVDQSLVRFRAHVASGTYLRSVAHDMGQALGCGAHLECLRRTAVAEFTLEDAHTLQEISEEIGKSVHSTASFEGKTDTLRVPAKDLTTEDAEAHRGKQGTRVAGILAELGPASALLETLKASFIHPRRLLPQMPSVTADELTTARIRAGRSVNLPELSRARQVKVFAGQRDLIAIATRIAGTLFHPGIVFA